MKRKGRAFGKHRWNWHTNKAEIYCAVCGTQLTNDNRDADCRQMELPLE